jgi:hypothetical protein
LYFAMPFQNSALFYFAGTQTTVIAQLTREEAIACHENGHWKEWGLLTRALFQLHQEFPCMPISVFHEAVEKTLGRPVFTHEFSTAGAECLKDEILSLPGASDAVNEVVNAIPVIQFHV